MTYLRDMTAEQREERLVQILMKTTSPTRDDAQAVLDLYVASKLVEMQKAIDGLENPYRRNRHRAKWVQGVIAVSSLLFRAEMRLYARVSLAERRRQERARV